MKKIVWMFILAFSVFSCSKNSNSSEPSEEGDSDEFCEYDYITDSIGDEAVSHECAITFTQLEEIQWRLENVKSPNMLARVRATWNKDITNAKKALKDYNGEEAHLLDSVVQNIEALHQEKCLKFSLPAISVIETLENCIKQLDNMKNKKDFVSFRDIRYGMIQDLDIIHLSVEPQSSKIGKVKRLAHTLKNKYEEKCKEYDVK